MNRRVFLSLAAVSLPGPALAQPATTPPWRGSGPPRTAEERAARHRWLEENWDTLPPEERRRVEDRFRRGMGPQGPAPEEMRRRWDSMSPGQRRELMGPMHRRGPGPHGYRGRPPAPAGSQN